MTLQYSKRAIANDKVNYTGDQDTVLVHKDNKKMLKIMPQEFTSLNGILGGIFIKYKKGPIGCVQSEWIWKYLKYINWN